jgi:hypothetical protein
MDSTRDEIGDANVGGTTKGMVQGLGGVVKRSPG